MMKSALEHFEGVEEFFDACKALRGKKVGIVGHIQMDGDAVGAQIALSEILKNEGCNVFLVETATAVPEPLKAFYAGLKTYLPEDIEVDEWCMVDCSQPSRAGVFWEKIRPFLLIDHHIASQHLGVHTLVHPHAAATCEIIADYLYQRRYPISVQLANALYLGLITDTGNYCYSATKASTLRLGAYLIDHGVSAHKIAALAYHHEPRRKFALLERFLRSWKFYASDAICLGFLRPEDYQETQTTMGDVEGFVNYPRSLQGVRIAGLVQEYEGVTKVSLRTDEAALRLNQIAQNFGGGGHFCAATFKTVQPFRVFEDALIQALQLSLKIL